MCFVMCGRCTRANTGMCIEDIIWGEVYRGEYREVYRGEYREECRVGYRDV